MGAPQWASCLWEPPGCPGAASPLGITCTRCASPRLSTGLAPSWVWMGRSSAGEGAPQVSLPGQSTSPVAADLITLAPPVHGVKAGAAALAQPGDLGASMAWWSLGTSRGSVLCFPRAPHSESQAQRAVTHVPCQDSWGLRGSHGHHSCAPGRSLPFPKQAVPPQTWEEQRDQKDQGALCPWRHLALCSPGPGLGQPMGAG